MIGKTMFLNFVALFFMFLTKRTVDSVQLSAPAEVTGTYGGSVMVSCQYDLQFKDNTKYWCKGPVYEFCGVVVRTSRNRPNKRSFIVDDKEAGIFTVTMTALGDSDEDTYWCVISRSGRNVYTSVRLIISPAVATTTATQTTSSLILEQTSWWAALRWILFILMLCGLALTHITLWWRTKKAGRKSSLKQTQRDNTVIFIHG
ncbi:CMRF35-like molecule 3 [Parambassis ranga]|uniref:CMRF35-like molecule 3 n=1 Tax=Parambassis ranga TaxID=210632 RepID=A0A6P7IJ59_9TELE|nr:CMRF35-like molecule 3 [Parambassis ranga]